MKEKFTFFYGKQSPFSQFYSCSLKVKGITFNCAEQCMMYFKAYSFGDQEMMDAIMAETNPVKIKQYGRQVTPFNPQLWSSVVQKIVFRANYAKFTQNPELKKILIATAGTTLVEASPRDVIWGIGLGASNPKALDRKNWRGRNLLGEILTNVREKIIIESKRGKSNDAQTLDSDDMQNTDSNPLDFQNDGEEFLFTLRFYEPTEPFGRLSIWSGAHFQMDGVDYQNVATYLKAMKSVRSEQNWLEIRESIIQKALSTKLKHEPLTREYLLLTKGWNLEHTPYDEVIENSDDDLIGKCYMRLRDNDLDIGRYPLLKLPASYVFADKYLIRTHAHIEQQINEYETKRKENSKQTCEEFNGDYQRYFDEFDHMLEYLYNRDRFENPITELANRQLWRYRYAYHEMCELVTKGSVYYMLHNHMTNSQNFELPLHRTELVEGVNEWYGAPIEPNPDKTIFKSFEQTFSFEHLLNEVSNEEHFQKFEPNESYLSNVLNYLIDRWRLTLIISLLDESYSLPVMKHRIAQRHVFETVIEKTKNGQLPFLKIYSNIEDYAVQFKQTHAAQVQTIADKWLDIVQEQPMKFFEQLDDWWILQPDSVQAMK